MTQSQTNSITQFKPIEYLKMDIANNFGLDKKPYSEKLEWFEENKDKLFDLIPEADEKPLFAAGLKAYCDYQDGKPSGYPVKLDAIASGMQFLSILSGCEKSAKLCGILNEDINIRPDPYTSIYKLLCDVLGVDGKITREHTKKAIMTSLYASVATPKNIFGEENYDTFVSVMEEAAPGAWKLNQYLQTLHKGHELDHRWILPDNFHVLIPLIGVETTQVNFANNIYEIQTKKNMPVSFSRSISPNIVHSIDGFVVREMVGRCSYNQNKVAHIASMLGSKNKSNNRHKDMMLNTLYQNSQLFNMTSVRILDYIDTDNIGNVDPLIIQKLISTLPIKRFDVSPIHDCFGCLPNYANDLRKQYNQIMHEIHHSKILENIISCIKRKNTNLPKLPSFGNKILSAEYSLC